MCDNYRYNTGKVYLEVLKLVWSIRRNKVPVWTGCNSLTSQSRMAVRYGTQVRYGTLRFRQIVRYACTVRNYCLDTGAVRWYVL